MLGMEGFAAGRVDEGWWGGRSCIAKGEREVRPPSGVIKMDLPKATPPELVKPPG